MINRDESAGMLLGLLGVAIFSLTLPATRAAVAFFDPFFVASGRAAIAGMLSVGVLALTRSPLPRRTDLPKLAVIACGVVFGFPFFTTWAMRFVPSAHGAVVLALLPLATALAGALVAHERPSPGFWAVSLLGSGVVLIFALRQGGGALHAADFALLAAIAAAALGYALGAGMSSTLGGWQTISWALVLALPVNLGLCAFITPHDLFQAPASAWLGFVYVSIFSMYIGFFPWYRALALGGIARVGQVQLLQPFMTLAGGWLLLGESFDPGTLLFALLVVVLVALGRKMPVRKNS